MRFGTFTRTAGPAWAGLAALTLVAPAYGQSQAQTPSAKASADSVSAEELSDEPARFYGKTVTIRQEVENVLGPRVFTLDDGEFFGTSPDILVFAPNAEAMPGEDSTVKVTGKVQEFAIGDLERQYGWGWGAYPWGYGYGYGYGLYGPVYGPRYLMRYEHRPVVIANSITTSSGRELVSDKPEQANAITNVSALTGSAGTSHVGQRVRLSELTVDRVVSARTFWAKGQGGERIFVALEQDLGDRKLQAGEKVSVSGSVARTPKDRQAIDRKTWNISDSDLQQLMTSAVFVRADAIQAGQTTS